MISEKKYYQIVNKYRKNSHSSKKNKKSSDSSRYSFKFHSSKRRRYYKHKKQRSNSSENCKIKLPPRQKTEQSPSEQTVKKLYSYTPTRSSRRNRNKSSRYYRQLELSMSRSYSGNNALRLFNLLRCIFQWLRDIFFPPRRR